MIAQATSLCVLRLPIPYILYYDSLAPGMLLPYSRECGASMPGFIFPDFLLFSRSMQKATALQQKADEELPFKLCVHVTS